MNNISNNELGTYLIRYTELVKLQKHNQENNSYKHPRVFNLRKMTYCLNDIGQYIQHDINQKHE